MTTPDIITAARKVVEAMGALPMGRIATQNVTDNQLVSDLRQTVKALSAALDAAAPGKPGAVPAGAAVFKSLTYEDYFVVEDGKPIKCIVRGCRCPDTPAWTVEKYTARFAHPTGAERRLSPEEAVAFLSANAELLEGDQALGTSRTKQHGAPGAGGGAK